jgi:uncharacterized membrane protein YeiH
MIGATPVAALSDWRYVAVSLLAGLLTFYFYSVIDRLSRSVLMFDAAGLALFAVTGATKALTYGLSPVAAALLGMLTALEEAWCATSRSRKFHWCCARNFTPSPLWPAPPSS